MSVGRLWVLTHPNDWPYWMHALRLLAEAAVAVAFAWHALVNARAEESAPGARRWAYGVYLFMLLLVAAANIVSFAVTLAARRYVNVEKYHVGLFSLLVLASYIPLLVRIRRPRL